MVHLYQDNPVGGANQLNSLLDVNISNPENKQIIYYDSTTGTWRNYNPPFVDHDDILHTIEECTASTDPNDVAGAAVASAINSNFTALIKTTAVDVNNLSDIPVNSMGRMWLASALRPSSSLSTYPFICFGGGGASQNALLVVAYNATVYTKAKNSGTWESGWHVVSYAT